MYGQNSTPQTSETSGRNWKLILGVIAGLFILSSVYSYVSDTQRPGFNVPSTDQIVDSLDPSNPGFNFDNCRFDSEQGKAVCDDSEGSPSVLVPVDPDFDFENCFFDSSTGQIVCGFTP